MTGWARYYDRLAADYDAMTAGDAWNANAGAAALVAPLGLRPSRVLDLGAGTGQTSLMLRRLYPAAELTLVEPSSGMLDVAAGTVPGAELVLDDASGFLARTEGEWDLVVALGLLELLPDMFEVVRLAAARLTPGGHLLVSHEPLLEEGLQSRPVSRVSGGLEVHRWSSAEVERHATSYDLTQVAVERVAAFERDDGEGAAVYELVVWRRGTAEPR